MCKTREHLCKESALCLVKRSSNISLHPTTFGFHPTSHKPPIIVSSTRNYQDRSSPRFTSFPQCPSKTKVRSPLFPSKSFFLSDTTPKRPPKKTAQTTSKNHKKKRASQGLPGGNRICLRTLEKRIYYPKGSLVSQNHLKFALKQGKLLFFGSKTLK